MPCYCRLKASIIHSTAVIQLCLTNGWLTIGLIKVLGLQSQALWLVVYFNLLLVTAVVCSSIYTAAIYL